VAGAVDEVVAPFTVDVVACDAIVGEDACFDRDVDVVALEVVVVEDVDVEGFGAVVVVLTRAVVAGIVCGVVMGGVVSTAFAGAGAGRTRT
jgi:hypothetical protein